jgi:hypothetical protein
MYRSKAIQKRVRAINNDGGRRVSLSPEGILFDHALPMGAAQRRIQRIPPMAVDVVLRVHAEQRAAAERAREQSKMALAIKGYDRLK